jgi:hypothetical protein
MIVYKWVFFFTGIKQWKLQIVKRRQTLSLTFQRSKISHRTLKINRYFNLRTRT